MHHSAVTPIVESLSNPDNDCLGLPHNYLDLIGSWIDNFLVIVLGGIPWQVNQILYSSFLGLLD